MALVTTVRRKQFLFKKEGSKKISSSLHTMMEKKEKAGHVVDKYST